MVAQALLIWLVTYVSLLALIGFLLYVGRSFGRQPWSDRALLRTASMLSFVGATVFWVLFVIVDR